MNINKILGMPVKDAQSVCEQVGYTLRVTKQDKQLFLGTCEVDEDRVNVHVENGKVAKIEGIG